MHFRNLLQWLLILSSTVVSAQLKEKGSFELMPTIGLTSSQFITEDKEGLSEYDPRGAVQVGILVDYYFNNRWSIRSGLSRFPMGAVTKELNYLNIPLNMNWHFGGTRRWNLNFGFSPGFLTSEDDYDIYKSYQFSLSYGIGYKFRISDKFSLMLDYQALLGLTNIFDDLFQNDFRRTNYGSSLNIGGVIAI